MRTTASTKALKLHPWKSVCWRTLHVLTHASREQGSKMLQHISSNFPIDFATDTPKARLNTQSGIIFVQALCPSLRLIVCKASLLDVICSEAPAHAIDRAREAAFVPSLPAAPWCFRPLPTRWKCFGSVGQDVITYTLAMTHMSHMIHVSSGSTKFWKNRGLEQLNRLGISWRQTAKPPNFASKGRYFV